MSAGVPMRELPRYKSHKIVHALKIKGVVIEDGIVWIVPDDKEYAAFEVDAAYYDKHKPQSGGYYVVYEDGYKSWSPAEAFESGYTLVSDFAIGGKCFWQDLARQLAEVWWEATKVGGTLQHGDLDKPETMFSVVLEKHGGRCFHGETPMDAWKKADAWLKSPERPSFKPDDPTTLSMEIAARVWCDQEMTRVVMDVEAATEIARILDRVRAE